MFTPFISPHAKKEMLYREDDSPNEKLAAAGMPPAPDDEYAAEWASIGVAMRRKYFAADYTTIDHPSRARDEALRLSMMHKRPVTSRLLDAWRKETIELTNIFATANTSGAPVTVQGEPVLGGAAHLHREPHVITKKNLFLHKIPARPTPSIVPYPIDTRNASVRFEWDNRIKARRECSTAMRALLEDKSHELFA